MISIVAVNRDFPKRSLVFSVKREMYFSWIVKGLLYFPWNVIYTPPSRLYHPLIWPSTEFARIELAVLDLLEIWNRFNKLTSVFHESVLLLTMNFVITLSKYVAVDLPTILILLWRNSLSVTGQTHEKLSSIFFTITTLHKFWIHVSVHLLTMKISQWARGFLQLLCNCNSPHLSAYFSGFVRSFHSALHLPLDLFSWSTF